MMSHALVVHIIYNPIKFIVTNVFSLEEKKITQNPVKKKLIM